MHKATGLHGAGARFTFWLVHPVHFSAGAARIVRHFACLLFVLLLATQPAAAGVVEYLHTDLQGNVVAVTDQSGAVIERYDYEPYGLPTSTDKPDNEMGYTGHVHDADSGLVYMQQRYYDPSIGQFLSVDPVLPNTTDGTNFNRYWYANSNPYKYVDPDGRYGVAGAFAGGVLDIAVQSIAIAASDELTINDFSIGSVIVSAGAGAIGVGVATKVAKLGAAAKASAGVASDAAISAGSTALKGEEVTLTGVAIDVAAGQTAGKLAGDAYADVVTTSDAYKVAERQADRLARIADKPGARQAQVDRAEGAATDLVQQKAAAAAEGSVVGSNAASELACSRMDDC